MTAIPQVADPPPDRRATPQNLLLTRVADALDRTSRGWALAAVVTAFLVALYLISFAAQVPFSAKYIDHLTGGHGVLDLMFAYTPTEGATALKALGAEGRHHYNYFQMADLVFPATYAVGLASLILALFRRRRIAATLSVIPLVTAAFDYLENIGVFLSLRTFPHPWHQALALASAAGAVKTVGSDIAQGVVVVGLIIQTILLLRRRG